MGRVVKQVAGERIAWGAVATAALVALAGKLVLALRTYGTNDVYYWQFFLDTYRQYGGAGLYEHVAIFNHPPCVVGLLAVLDALSHHFAGGFPFWLRLPATLADLASLLIVWNLLRQERNVRSLEISLLLMAACPISLLVSGFHGNTDPLMIMFVLLAIGSGSRGQPWLAGVAYGMSMNVKVAPLIFAPFFVFYFDNWRSRLQFVASAAALWLLASLPLLVQSPLLIAHRVFGYTSLYGSWGLACVLERLPAPLLSAWFRACGRHVVLALLFLTAFGINRGERRPSLFSQCSLAAFMFLGLTPGFGVQYLSWLVPFAVEVGVGATLAFYLTGGVFLTLVYNFWAGGLPWYYANSLDKPFWPPLVSQAGLACWAVVVAVGVAALHHCLEQKEPRMVELRLADPVFRRRLQWVALCLLLSGGTVLRWHLNDVSAFSRADESIYLEYVTTLRDHGGVRHYDSLVEWYLGDPSMSRYPTPYRYAYILGAYGVASVTGDFTHHALATLSTLCSIGLFVIAVLMAYGAGGLPLALVCGTLLLASPLELAMGRRALSDMPLAAATLAALWALWSASRHSSRVLAAVAVVGVMLTLAVQERGVLAIIALLPWLLTRHRFERRWPIREIVIIGCGCLAYYLGFCLVSHSFTSMFAIVAKCTHDVSLNEYCVQYQNGPFYGYFINLLTIMPLATLLFPLSLYLLYTQDWSHPLLRYVASFAVGFLSIMLLGCACTEGAFFNLRYILSLDAPLCLVVAAGILELTRRAIRLPLVWRVGGLVLVLTANLALEWRIFYQIFVTQAIYDPISLSIYHALRLIP
jgi:hypothetical protein